MANASHKHGMGAGLVQGHQTAGDADAELPDEDDLVGQVKGMSRHPGPEDGRSHNERTTVPGSQEPRNQPDAVAARIEEEARADRD
jgi:hypothetical protein